jgi:branched-chain amino acid aminotransferase
MLDNLGFVSETNDCNIFMVKKNVLLTPHADACLTGITRETTIKLAYELNITCVERNISISEFYNADEVFITGTMGELTPVYEVDGRVIENKSNSEIRNILYKAFKKLTETEGEPI